MNLMDFPTLQREHPTVADHARQEAEHDLESLKHTGLFLGIITGLALALLGHLLEK